MAAVERMFSCTSCGAQLGGAVGCPHCGKLYCAACYQPHAQKENDKQSAHAHQAGGQKTPFAGHAVWQMNKWQGDGEAIVRARPAYMRRKASTLKDTEGTPAPAATAPKVYRGGGGSPGEPPEAAGAPNRPPHPEARKRKSY